MEAPEPIHMSGTFFWLTYFLIATFEAVPGASFDVVGAIPAKNAALLSGGAELRLAGGTTLGARFDGELASGAHAYAGTVFLRVSF